MGFFLIIASINRVFTKNVFVAGTDHTYLVDNSGKILCAVKSFLVGLQTNLLPPRKFNVVKYAQESFVTSLVFSFSFRNFYFGANLVTHLQITTDVIRDSDKPNIFRKTLS